MKRRIGKLVVGITPLIWLLFIRVAEAANTTNNRGDLFKPFGYGGSMWGVTEILIAAIGGTVTSLLASALGKGDLAAFIKLLTKLGCIGIVIKEISKATWSVFTFIGY